MHPKGICKTICFPVSDLRIPICKQTYFLRNSWCFIKIFWKTLMLLEVEVLTSLWIIFPCLSVESTLQKFSSRFLACIFSFLLLLWFFIFQRELNSREIFAFHHVKPQWTYLNTEAEFSCASKITINCIGIIEGFLPPTPSQ